MSVVNTQTVILSLSFLVALYVLNAARLLLSGPLRSLPGPFETRFSGLYRLSMVYKGTAPENYRKLHEKYGKIVRTSPVHVSISEASAIPTIYGLGSKYLKSPFYTVLSPFYKGTKMDSMFTERNPAHHKVLKTPVAQLFSMTNMRSYEPYADECTAIFTNAMKDLQGRPVDLAIWLQRYAFDVIGSITFQRRFGFMEERKDVGNMIGGLDAGLRYIGVVGQYPEWHRWLVGNRTLMSILTTSYQAYPIH